MLALCPGLANFVLICRFSLMRFVCIPPQHSVRLATSTRGALQQIEQGALIDATGSLIEVGVN